MKTKQVIQIFVLIGMLAYLLEIERRFYPKISELKTTLISNFSGTDSNEYDLKAITIYQKIK